MRAFLDDLGVSFPHLRDADDRITRVFRLVGVPETLLVDRSGRIAHRWVGAFDPLDEDTAAKVQAVLAIE